MELRGLMGGFYRISEWIMRLSVTNLLWVVCSFPFFFLVLTSLLAVSENPDLLMQSIILVSAVVPFTLFPATAALFGVARKWVTGEADAPMFKTFFKGYKENYLQSMIGGLFFILLYVIVYVNYTFYLKQEGNLSVLAVVFIVFTVILTCALFYFFSLMVHFHMKIFQLIKNSILLTIGNPLTTFLMIVTNFGILYVSVFKYTFLIPFFMGSLLALFSFFYFNRIFDKIKLKTEKAQKLQEEKEEKERISTDSAEGNEEYK